jgi:2-polyprenyl-3-methyl-5-hydroxy-6-metoxy-1,4-benzoquinol methylase
MVADDPSIPDDRRWNHNIASHDWLLAGVDVRVDRALDIGCGDGMLARRLRTVADRVVAIDVDADQIDLARAETAAAGIDGIDFVLGDALLHDLGAGFDLVTSVATLHHLPLTTALRRFADLVRPGGQLAIAGLARSTTPRDYAFDLAGAVLTRWKTHTGGRVRYEHSAPIVWPPPNTYREVEAAASDALPGSEFRRRALWRYTVTWTRPAAS